ncbi:MAG: hypothetical protein QM648_04415 [Solirubrobacterales bacterium]
MSIRWVVLGALTAVLFVLPAGEAGAYAQLGANPSLPANSGSSCVSATSCTFFQAADDGATPYAASSSGVLTGFTINQGSSMIGVNTAQLRVFRPNGGSTWKVVGESPATAMFVGCCGAIPSTLPARVPVQAGDRIGVTVHYDGNTAWQSSAGAGNTVAQVTGVNPSLGSVLVPLNLLATANSKVNVTASFEPDADHDGFGDITQDLCPNNPAHGDTGCSAWWPAATFRLRRRPTRRVARPTACMPIPRSAVRRWQCRCAAYWCDGGSTSPRCRAPSRSMC